MARSGILTAVPAFLLACGTQDICRSPEVDLTSSSGAQATYELSFQDTSCEIIVPGEHGFEVETPETATCASDQGEFNIYYLDPDRPGCTPDGMAGSGVSQGTCWDGAPTTRLIWLGTQRNGEAVVVTLSGPTSRTIDVRTACNVDPIEVDLSE